MKKTKKLIAAIVSATMICSSITVFGAASPSKKVINDVKPTKVATVTYQQGVGQPLTIVINGVEMKEGVDFVISGKKGTSAGTYTVKITGIGAYSGTTTITYTIAKASQNKVTVKAVKSKVKASVLKRKAVKTKIKVKNAKGKITYKSMSKKIKVSKKGKVTIKKGTKKGTYKIKVKIAATKNYKAKTKTVKIKVK